MRQPVHAKRLLVEGKKDQRLIPYILEQNGIDWPASNYPVQIEVAGSRPELLNREYLTSNIKLPGLKALGLIVDADEACTHCWESVRTRCQPLFPKLNETLPAEGLVHVRQDGLRFGVWIMPDNSSPGMFETFLHRLVPAQSQSTLFDFAKESCRIAKHTHGAPYKDVHYDKALVHTWLAWQDEPGPQLHEAIMRGPFLATSSNAQPFISWFCDLFELRPKEAL